MSQYREQAIKLVLEMRNKHGYAGSNHALAERVLELEAENERLRNAVKAYRFLEQTNGGKNPHRVGTNAYRAFELGSEALSEPPKGKL